MTRASTSTDPRRRKAARLFTKRFWQRQRHFLKMRMVLQVKSEKDGADSLPAEYLASPLSKQPQEPPQPKQVGN